MVRRGTIWLFGLLLAVLLCPPAAAGDRKHSDIQNIGQRDITEGSWNLYSIEKEINLGHKLAGDVETNANLLHDRLVQNYMDDLVQRLARNSDTRVPFTVKVIDSDEINAFALPGGFLYVNTGLIHQTKTEAELAGILAHEIAHVTARHMTKQMTKARLLQWFTLPLIFVGGPVGFGIQQALGLAVPLSFLKFERGAETEADFLGLQYTYRAGYDPTALIDILERLKEIEGQKEGGLAKIFSSHPMTHDRIEKAQAEIAEVLPPRSDYVVSTSEFEAMKTHLRRIQQGHWLFEPGEEGGPRLRRRTTK
jgi:predicted Zn-dependent protease